jgi:hypothetical protein
MPYYIVKNMQTNVESLVEADNKTQAFRLIGEALLSVDLAAPTDIVSMMEAGQPVLRSAKSQLELKLEEDRVA